MDGEHAFSASLTLVMVNVAFPYNERDARAMETALSVLRRMAEKGNEYIQARLDLLMNLRATIGRRTAMNPPNTSGQALIPNFTTTIAAQSVPHGSQISSSQSMLLQDNVMQLGDSFQPFQDVSLNFDVDDDPKFWEELSGNIDIDMDTGWIENALRQDAYQGEAGN